MGPGGPIYLTMFFHTHQSFSTGQADGGHGVGEGGDIEPSLRLQHKFLQGPLEGAGEAIHTGLWAAGVPAPDSPRGACPCPNLIPFQVTPSHSQ